MLKLAAGEISDSITKIFNDSLKSGCIPSEWNLGNIIPNAVICRLSVSFDQYQCYLVFLKYLKG